MRMNTEIMDLYKLFKPSLSVGIHSIDYLVGENKIFTINEYQKIILLYNFKDMKLDLEMILHFDNNLDSILNPIRENGFNNYKTYLLFNDD